MKKITEKYEQNLKENLPDPLYNMRAFLTFITIAIVACFALEGFAEDGERGRSSKKRSISEVYTSKETYDAQEKIGVNFSGFPSNKQDWITIVDANAPDNTYKQWFYLEGRNEGSLTFKGLQPGKYEVRGYHDWPSGSYRVKARYSFSVVSSEGFPASKKRSEVRTSKETYDAQEKIRVNFSGFPGNKQDWITVVNADASESTYQEWFYLEGRNEGRLTFKGLKPGKYEVRGYHDWPSGSYRVKARYSFTVE